VHKYKKLFINEIECDFFCETCDGATQTECNTCANVANLAEINGKICDCEAIGFYENIGEEIKECLGKRNNKK
jgi:hypothetical protein